jgi:arylsulfatase A-like enzyme
MAPVGTREMTKPNIVFFLWDNLGWGEVGCYGGGVLRGAPTPRIDALAAQGSRLPNFNVEAQCTPSRSALLTGRHPIRSGTHTIPITGGPEGLTRWEVSIAQALADAGYATTRPKAWLRLPIVSALLDLPLLVFTCTLSDSVGYAVAARSRPV